MTTATAKGEGPVGNGEGSRRGEGTADADGVRRGFITA